MLVYTDVDGLLRTVLSGVPSATIQQLMPANYLDLLPLIVARRVGGTTVDMRGLDRAVCMVDCYDTDRSATFLLAWRAQTALYEAWRQQTTTEFGHLGFWDEQAAPVEVRTDGQPNGVTRVSATYLLTVRPPQ